MQLQSLVETVREQLNEPVIFYTRLAPYFGYGATARVPAYRLRRYGLWHMAIGPMQRRPDRASLHGANTPRAAFFE